MSRSFMSADPVPALEYAQNLQKRAEKVSDLEVENQKLRETLGKRRPLFFARQAILS